MRARERIIGLCIVITTAVNSSAGELGAYMSTATGRIAFVEIDVGGKASFKDENENEANSTIDFNNGKFSAYEKEGRILPNGNISWPGTEWLRISGMYFSVANDKTTRIESHCEQLLLVDENGRRAVAKIDKRGAFKAWGIDGKITPSGVIVWPGNEWKKVVHVAKAVTPAPNAPVQYKPPAKSPVRVAMDDVQVVNRKSGDGSSVLLYLRNNGGRPITATVESTHFQNGKHLGGTKDDHTVQPKREKFIGSPTVDSTGFKVRYKVINAYYK